MRSGVGSNGFTRFGKPGWHGSERMLVFSTRCGSGTSALAPRPQYVVAR
ncbi:MAG TPA: hypothetical protein PKZ53_12385 [Acidobacteriota bacterium]|nr:hypothetical protein [Acidobacteriota bacterium]HNJ41282.1 hypothetical protein [Acidobacteriota bacterium]